MACQVNRNNQGQITSVLDRNGNESKIFNDLASLPYIDTLEQALEIYKQSYKDNIDERQGISFQTETGLFPNLQEALQLDETVNVGYFNSEGFQTLYIIPSQFNRSTKEGFISSYVRDGILSDRKETYNGQSFFKASGTNYAEQKLNEEFLESESKVYLGAGSFISNEGLFTIQPQQINKNILNETEQNIVDRLSEELTKANITPNKGSFKPRQINERDLKLKLLNILDTLGVNTLSISEYVEKYGEKNNIEPTATGLADIANRIVALKEGQATLDDLTEETLHFIVEALPQETVQEFLQGIENTPEYNKYSDKYTEIYSKNYPEAQVEELVKKEVLAKVMKNQLLQKEGNLFQRIVQAIQRFLNSLNSNNVYNNLSNINELLEELFIQENLDSLNPERLEGSNIVLYSVTDQRSGDTELDRLRAINKAILTRLQVGVNFLKSNKSSVASENQELRELEEQLNAVNGAGVVLDFLGLTKRKIDALNSAFIRIENEGGNLSLSEINLINNIKEGLPNLLAAQKDQILKITPTNLGLESSKDKNDLIKKIDETILQINNVAGRAENIQTEALEDIVDRIADQQELSEEEKERYRDFALNTGNQIIKDTGFFMSTFGQLIHASDPLLNMTANVIAETRYKETEWTQRDFRALANRLDDLGVSAEDLSTNLTDNGYLLSKYDWNRFNTLLDNIEKDAYNEVKGTKVTVDTYKDLKKEGKLDLNPDQYNNFKIRKGELLEPYIEKPMDSNYYNKQKEKYQRLNISNNTIVWLKTLSASRAEVQNRARQEDGTVIYTEDQKHTLTSISRKRKEEKSFFDSNGNLKQGIVQRLATAKLVQNLQKSKERYVEKGGLVYTLDSSPSEKAVRAFDISIIDQDYLNDLKQRNNNISKFVKTFFDISAKSYAKGVDFIKNNLGLSLSSEFWDRATRESILDNDYINSLPENQRVLSQIKELSQKRSEIKRLFQDSTNPSEVEGDEMLDSTKEQIKTLTDRIESLKTQLVGIDEVQLEESEIEISKQPNRAYFRALKKKGFEEFSKEEEEYIYKNSSDRARTRFTRTLLIAEKLDNNESVSDRQKERLDAVRQEGETYYQAFIRLSRTNLLPYYQRFTPEGYETLDDVIDINKSDKENADAIVSFINRKNNDPNYELNIHYTFQPEEDNGFANPNYNSNFEGGFYQPKISEFRNEKYFQLFKPDSNGNPTQNTELFEAHKQILDLQRNNLKNIGEYGKHNIFLLPQISRTGLNKTVDFIKSKNKGETLKATLRDTFNYNVDDKAYGEEESQVVKEATDAKVIPKFYLRPLEEKTDVSEDIFWSYLMFTKHANLYKARQEGINDILALEKKIISRNYAEGKAAQSTSNYNMFEAAVNNNFYGIRETRQFKVNLPLFGEVDFTKTLRTIANYVRMRNLGGLNLITPFTSLITGEVQVQIERSLGEYLPSDALSMASKEFRKLAPDASKRSLEYNDKSKLNVLGEFLGVYQNEEKAANARYGVIGRTFPKLGFIMHKVGNFPIIPRVFLTELFDNRVVNGRIVNKQQFFKARKTQQSKPEIEAAWKLLEDKVLYNYLNVTEETVEFKPELLNEIDGDTDYLQNKITGIRKRINQNSTFIDSQISEKDRTAAQLNSMWSFVTMHRSFLTVGATRRFKKLQYNIESGAWEEGSYVTLKNTLIDAFGNLSKTKNVIKAFKEAYKNPEKTENLTTEEAVDLRRRNLKRIGVEFAFMGSIVLIASALKAMADDEENKDAYGWQLSNYLFMRLANETASSQFAIGNELASVIKSPTVGYQNIVNTLNFLEAFDTEEIKQGTYKGLTKSERYFIRATPGVQSYFDLLNPKKKADVYQFYNKSNLDWGSLGSFSLLTEEDK